MSLASFKKSIKSTSVIIFLIVYGLGFYLIGKNSSLVNNFSVKGIKDQRIINTPIESPIPYADTQVPTIQASFVKLCSNTSFGFEVAYPKEWFTTYNTEDQKCTFFAPYSFILPYETGNFIVPARIEIVNPADWQGTVKFYENPNDFYNILSVEDIQIASHAVRKIESKSTEAGQFPRNFTRTIYLISDSINPIVVTYMQLEDKEDVEANKKVLEEIVASLRYF